MKSEDCSSHLHEFCNPCECSCHGDYFDLDEVRALYRIIENQWINRDDLEAMKVVDRISQIVNEKKIPYTQVEGSTDEWLGIKRRKE